MSATLAVQELSAGYGPLRVLHDISLEISEGERVGLVGLNGHGKTTLLRAIVGLVDWRRGEIRLRGRSIADTPTHALVRAGLVMIPQGDLLFPGLSVRENLDSGAFSGGAWRTRSERRQRVLALFPRLVDRLDQLAGTLSGGERRMVALGRGLMTDADVFLIDEPSLGLAPGLATGLIEKLTTLELGKGAMLIVEQNRPLVDGKLDRIVRLHGGQIVEDERSPGGGQPEPQPGRD